MTTAALLLTLLLLTLSTQTRLRRDDDEDDDELPSEPIKGESEPVKGQLPAEISGGNEEKEGPPSLIKYGHFCHQPTDFEVDGPPAESTPPFELEIFEVRSKSDATATLHLIIRPQSITYQYLVLMALNENGVPTGHFHDVKCIDKQSKYITSGVNHYNEYCTRKDDKTHGTKWGTTRMMFTTFHPEESYLKDVSVFWSWTSEDGASPTKIQFKYAPIKANPDELDTYWIMASPVISFVNKYANKIQATAEGSCYSYKVTTTSTGTGSFRILKESPDILVNQELIGDLYPAIKNPENSSLPTGKAGPLVRYGHICQNIEEIDVEGKPQNEAPPFKVTVYELLGKSEVNSLHIVVSPTAVPYHALVIQALNESGLPIGHFHHFPCKDPSSDPQGSRELGGYCTKAGEGHGLKWGNTRLMYTLFDDEAGQKHLGPQSVFWSLSPKDYKAQSRIQFKLIAMRVVEGGKDIYWLGQSPVIQYSPKLEYEEPNYILTQSSGCYTDLLTEHSKHNFAIAKDQNPLKINMGYLQDLFPELESTVSTVPSPLSVVTTTPATPDKDYEEAEDDSTPSTLVRYGLFCKNIQAFDVDGVPQNSEAPLKITIYELKSPSTANTLHLLFHSPTQPYKYIVLMAINEKGVPAGHFHHQVCADPTIFNGWHNMGRYCTRRGGRKGEKWGDTSLMFITPRPGQTVLGDQDAFWSWDPKDGVRPNKLQFRLAVIQAVEDQEDIFWVNIVSPVIDVDDKIKYEKADDMDRNGIKCYADELGDKSGRNFRISSDQKSLKVNMEYLWDLFPALKTNISRTTLVLSTTTPSVVQSTTTLATTAGYKSTTKVTTASSKAPSTEKVATTESSLEVEYVEPEDSGNASTLVRYGHFCRNVHAFDVDGVPQSSDPPIQIALYELKSPSSTNSLHVVVHSSSQQYQYLVAMAVNQNGTPTGHFHHQVCKDPKSNLNGLHQLNRYCTRKNTELGEKWGPTSLMFIMPRGNEKFLQDQGVFWSWHPKDGERPTKLQFRLAVVKAVDGEEDVFWVNVLSPVVEFKDKLRAAEADDMSMTGVKCYTDAVTDHTDGNFLIATDQMAIDVNTEYIGDLFPELRPATQTTPASTTTVRPEPEEEWGDFILTPLIRHGLFCKNIKALNVTTDPSVNGPSVTVTVYGFKDSPGANTLHVLVNSTEPYHYLVVMAVNENGIPTGHFHHQVCADARVHNGVHEINKYCTRRGSDLGNKWGPTSMMYVTTGPNGRPLSEENAFWSWSLKDGDRPSRIQFRMAVIQLLEGMDEALWVSVVSPVIEFRNIVNFEKPNDAITKGSMCYEHILKEVSDGNFVLSTNNTDIAVNVEYMLDLFPEFGVSETDAATIASTAVTFVTDDITTTKLMSTTPASTTTIRPEPEEEWGDFILTPLIRHGLFCKNIKALNITTDPTVSGPSVTVTVFDFKDPSGANTLHVLVNSTEPYHYLVVMAVNENGLPTGHFHHQVCADARTHNGVHEINKYCTRRGSDLGNKWGATSMMYVTTGPNGGPLTEENTFWSWNSKDGERPSRIQFRMAVIQLLEGMDEALWVNVLSPVVEFRNIVEYEKPNDAITKSSMCYKNVLTEASDRNFRLSMNISDVPINMEYMLDLFPEFGVSETDAVTIASTAVTFVTDDITTTKLMSTTPASTTTIRPEPEEEWGDFILTPLIRHGLFCKNIKALNVTTDPTVNGPSVTVTVYGFKDSPGANTLHVLVNSTEPYHYLVVMAVNENGIPTGHFHHQVCADARTHNGVHEINKYCTRRGSDLGNKWGPTSLMYVTHKPNAGPLSEENVFWSWNQKDGDRPSRIQFRMAVIQSLEGMDESLWVNVVSPVIEFRNIVNFEKPNDAITKGSTCYEHMLTEASGGNFILSMNHTDIAINMEYMLDLFPEFGVSETDAVTVASTAVTFVTDDITTTKLISTTPASTTTIRPEPEEEWGDFILTPLIRHGLFCKNIKALNVTTDPTVNGPSVTVTVFDFKDPSGASTLHVLVNSTEPYHYLVVMAVNENGLPTGHFHHQVCADARVHNGVHQIKKYCTRRGSDLGNKWGPTSLMYVTHKSSGGPLNEENAFWSWDFKDGDRPSRIQFRIAVVQLLEGMDEALWVKVVSPVIELRDKVQYEKPSDAIMKSSMCYENILTEASDRNFFLSKNQSDININMEYMLDLFPGIGVSETEAATVASTAVTFVTEDITTTTLISTTSSNISKTALTTVLPKSSSVPTGQAGPLVRYGHICQNIEEIDVEGKPQNEAPPFKVTVYELLGKSEVNSLHIVVSPTAVPYHALVIQALNESGLPIGHFHHFPCKDPSSDPQGSRELGGYCTKAGEGHGLKWGNTRLMYTLFDDEAGQKHLGPQSVFWSLSPKDYKAQSRIQFKLIAMRVVEGGKDIYWLGQSPVIQYSPKLEYEEPNYILTQSSGCYTDLLTEHSKHNFAIAKDQNPLKINMGYLQDLFPELESTVSTVPSPLSVVTTTPATPDKDYEEAEDDSTPSTLVRYGLFCKNIQAFDVDGVPQNSEAPLKITIYELKSPSTANTLHLLFHSPTQPYKYIVLMAINEKGVPAGHFHHQVCADPTIFNGWHNMGRYCTRRGGRKGEKWGDTSLMFITPRPGQTVLGDQDAFWSWDPKDGVRPNKLQFRLAVIQAVEDQEDIFWVNIVSPVIDVDDKIKYEKADDMDRNGIKCYADELGDKSGRNFRISSDQKSLKVNMEYLWDLFPALKTNISRTTLVLSTTTPSVVQSTTTLATTAGYKSTTKVTTASSKAPSTEKVATTESSLEVEYVEPEDSGNASTLVRYGHFCRNVHAFDVDGVPQSSDPPIQIALYELKSPSSTNSLHVVVHSSSQQYQYLVAMAVNQNGTPTGHFHHQVCKDPKSNLNGLHQLNRYCTRKNTELGEKWGPTSLMFIMPRGNEKFLQDQGVFWSWHPKDGERPTKLQFRLAVVKAVDGEEDVFWVNVLSPVVEFKDKLRAAEADDMSMTGVKCYTDAVTDHTDGNFLIATDQMAIDVNTEYIGDLFPELRPATQTTPASTTTVRPEPEEEWGDFILTPLIRHGLFCKNIKALNVTTDPSVNGPSVTVTVYGFKDSPGANTLHVLVNSTEPYHYLVVMAVNENGIPTGHFHHQVCADARVHNGVHEINKYCTRRGSDLGNKWGPTSMMYVTTGPNGRPLSEENAFWSWSLKDGDRPSRIQFRMAVIQLLEGMDEALWVSVVSPVIEFRNIVNFEKPNDAITKGSMCYEHILKEVSDGNFVLSTNNTDIAVNVEYMLDLFPEFGVSETDAATIASTAVTFVTDDITTTKLMSTTPASTTTIRPEPEEEWGDFILTPLIRHGLFCKNIKALNITTDPTVSGPSVTVTVFDFKDPSGANTLHVLVNSTEPYHYLVVMAVNENGLPTGHFHHQVCADARTHNGVHEINKYCTRRGSDLGNKWGATSMMYVTTGPNGGPLTEENTFWSWNSKDGERPSRIQFRMAVIQLLEGMDEALWVNVLSPVVEFRNIVEYEKPNDAITKSSMCYKNVLTEASDRNFRLSMNISDVPINMEYMLDLFPEFGVSETDAVTIASTAVTFVTDDITTTKLMSTTPASTTTIRPEPEEEWGDFILTPLIRHGLFCKNIKALNVTTDPTVNGPSVTVTVYGFKDSPGANTLHVLVNSTEPYHYLVVMAVNENGIPTGHFHHQVCADARTHNGVHEINKYCTRRGSDLGNKWGPTSLMYVTHKPNAGPLSEENVFWSWNQKDGDRPSRIQFRMAVIQSLEGMDESLWVNVVSPVIEFRNIVNFEKPNDAITKGSTCYEHMLTEASGGNFILSMNHTDIAINMEYMLDLFPEFGVSETDAVTVASTAVTFVTDDITTTKLISTTPASTTTIRPEPEEEWGDFILTPLIRHGLFCKNIKALNVTTDPTVNGPSVTVTVFDFKDPSGASTLHVLVNSTEPYHYLVVMAVNENGLPTGHFHHQVCADARVHNGVHQIKKYCTRRGSDLGNKWGPTSLMYVTHKSSGGPLNEENAFWSWDFKDGDRPSRIQFRIAVVQLLEGMDEALWVKVVSPVIELRDKVQYEKPSDAIMKSSMCYENILTEASDRNFFLSKNQSDININMEYMLDLFPGIGVSETEAATVASTAVTFVTEDITTTTLISTTSSNISKTALTTVLPKSSSVPTGQAGPLVRYGHICQNIEEIDVEGKPQNEAPPFKVTVYELLGKSEVNSLHIVVSPTAVPYHALVIQALNESGLPIGHFHHFPCKDPSSDPQGSRELGGYCTKAGEGHGLKWGNTRLMYTLFDDEAGQKHLGPQSVFWSLSPKDYKAQSRIQFKLIAMRVVEGGKDIYWLGQSPVIQYSPKLEYEEPNYILTQSSGCYTDLLTEHSKHNFAIAKDQNPLKINMGYLQDLFPELESTVSTVPSPLSVVTTTPATPDKDYEEAEDDSTPSTLVRYGLFCKNIQAFDVDGVPQNSEAPLKITIYELKSPSTANTLHLLFHSPTQPYKYIVLMAINEKGVPAGHFHHQVCADPTIFNGWHNMGRYCTRRGGRKGEKWGDTSLMFITPRPGQTVLGDQDAFWSWDPKDGVRPNKLQFRLAVIQAVEDQEDIFWVNIVSPVIDVDDKIKYEKADDMDRNGIKCYADELGDKSGRNFRISSDQKSLKVNMEYLWDLFPALKTNISRTTLVLSTTTPSVVQSTTTLATTAGYKSTTKVTTASSKAPSTEKVATTESSLEVEYVEPEDSGNASTLVRYGHFCRNVHAFDVDGVPQSSDPPIQIALYELKSPSSTNSLHVVVHSSSQQYQYLVAMAVNQNGTPTGHFHHQVCKDPKSNLNGLHQLNRYCTRKNTELGEKWGPTSLMFIMPRGNEKFLQDQGVFWSWHPKDGERPTKLQFRLAVVKAVDGEEDVFWVNVLSPVVEFKDKLRAAEADDMSMTGVKCYTDAVTDHTDGNFLIATDQMAIDVNTEYIGDLFPELRPATQSVPASILPRTLATTEAGVSSSIKVTLLKSEPTQPSTQVSSSTFPEEESVTLSIPPESIQYRSSADDTIQEIPQGIPAVRNITVNDTEPTAIKLESTIKKERHGAQNPGPTEDTVDSSIPPPSLLTTTSSSMKEEMYGAQNSGPVEDTVDSNTPPPTLLTTTSDEEPVVLSVPPESIALQSGDVMNDIKNAPQAMSTGEVSSVVEIAPMAMKPVSSVRKLESGPQEDSTIEDVEPYTSRLGKKTTKKPTSLRTSGSEYQPPYYFPLPPFNKLKVRHVYEACHMGKGCFGDTRGCIRRRTCKILITYSTNHYKGPDYVRFEILAKMQGGVGYAAVAISHDRTMGDDSVVECLSNKDGKTGVFSSWNSGHNNYRPKKFGQCQKMSESGPISSCNVTLEDDVMICHFFRKTVSEVEGKTFDLRNKAFYVFQALGYTLRESPQKETRKRRRRSSDRDLSERSGQREKKKTKRKQKVNDNDVSPRTSATSMAAVGKHSEVHISPKAIRIAMNEEHELSYWDVMILKLHGVFMSIAWVTIVPNAAFIARYFKESYRNVKFFGIPVWLFVHVSSVIVAGVLIFIGIICGLYYTYGVAGTLPVEQHEWTHFVVGWIGCILFCIQLLIGVLRPKQPGRLKMVIDVMHFFVGTSCYLLALFLIGRSHLMVTSYFHCHGALVVVIWASWSLLVHTVVSVNTFLTDHHDLNLKTMRAFLPWPFPVLTQKPVPGEFFRTHAFTFHASGAAIATTWIILPYLVNRYGCECQDSVCI